MPIRDLSTFFDDGLDYPGVPSREHPGGKTYHVPAPEAIEGLRMTALAQIGTRAAAGIPVTTEDLASLQLNDGEEHDFYTRVLTAPVLEEMKADGVKWPMVTLIAQDAYLNFAMSPDAADAVLAGLGKPQARTNRATRRAGQRTPKKTAGSKSSRVSSGTPDRTRSQGSTRSSKTPGAKAAD